MFYNNSRSTYKIMSHVTIVTVAILVTSCGGIVERGPMNNAMLLALKTYPTVRQVTVSQPQKVNTTCQSRYNRVECKWQMTAEVLGDYDVDKTIMYMSSDKCLDYTEHDWFGAFPCVFNRDDLSTTCNGPLPLGTENTTWSLGYTLVDPINSALPQKNSPSPRNVTATPFKAERTLLSLASLGLAKCIQMSGVYSGSGVITTSVYGNQWDIEFDSEDAQFELDTRLVLPDTEPRRLNVSWTAWLEGDRMILDVLASWHADQSDDHYDYAYYESNGHIDRPKRSLSTLNPNVAESEEVLAPGNPPSILTRTVVSYSRNDIKSSRITIDDRAHAIKYTGALKALSLEPRLCPAITAVSACNIMSAIALDPGQLRNIGNVTAFYLRDMSRCRYKRQDYICTTGNAAGTKGLRVGMQYKSYVVNSNDPAWMELPIKHLSRCTGRVYKFSDCQATKQHSHVIGPPVNTTQGTVHKF